MWWVLFALLILLIAGVIAIVAIDRTADSPALREMESSWHAAVDPELAKAVTCRPVRKTEEDLQVLLKALGVDLRADQIADMTNDEFDGAWLWVRSEMRELLDSHCAPGFSGAKSKEHCSCGG